MPPGETSWTLSPPAHVQAKEHLKSLAERALPQKTIEDRIGLTRAYEAPDSIYIYGEIRHIRQARKPIDFGRGIFSGMCTTMVRSPSV